MEYRSETELRARVCSIMIVSILVILLVNGGVLLRRFYNNSIGFEIIGEGTPDEHRVYLVNNIPVTGFYYADNGICYFDEDGKQVYGFRDIDGETYYFSPDTGHPLSNVTTVIDDRTYKFDYYGRIVREQ